MSRSEGCWAWVALRTGYASMDTVKMFRLAFKLVELTDFHGSNSR